MPAVLNTYPWILTDILKIILLITNHSSLLINRNIKASLIYIDNLFQVLYHIVSKHLRVQGFVNLKLTRLSSAFSSLVLIKNVISDISNLIGQIYFGRPMKIQWKSSQLKNIASWKNFVSIYCRVVTLALFGGQISPFCPFQSWLIPKNCWALCPFLAPFEIKLAVILLYLKCLICPKKGPNVLFLDQYLKKFEPPGTKFSRFNSEVDEFWRRESKNRLKLI